MIYYKNLYNKGTVDYMSNFKNCWNTCVQSNGPNVCKDTCGKHLGLEQELWGFKDGPEQDKCTSNCVENSKGYLTQAQCRQLCTKTYEELMTTGEQELRATPCLKKCVMKFGVFSQPQCKKMCSRNEEELMSAEDQELMTSWTKPKPRNTARCLGRCDMRGHIQAYKQCRSWCFKYGEEFETAEE